MSDKEQAEFLFSFYGATATRTDFVNKISEENLNIITPSILWHIIDMAWAEGYEEHKKKSPCT